MDRINFVRNFKNHDGWEQAEITEEENTTIQKQLREINNRIFAECLKDAHEAMKQFIAPYSNPLPQIQQSADKLFEKRAIHSLTAYQEFLTAKINRLRNETMDEEM
jgi:hypothetical protein